MRNPERIKEVLDTLTKVWEVQPDTRFNQLIYNLQREYSREVGRTFFIDGRFPSQEPYDLFNVEDDKFLEFLKNKIKEG